MQIMPMKTHNNELEAVTEEKIRITSPDGDVRKERDERKNEGSRKIVLPRFASSL